AELARVACEWREEASGRFLFFSDGGDARQGTSGAAAGSTDHRYICCRPARAAHYRSHSMVAWNSDLWSGCRALVCAGAGPQSAVFQRILLAAQRGAIYHEPVPASTPFLVLPAGLVAGTFSLDDIRVFRLCRCNEKLA